MENFKDIKDYEGLYQVSNLGRVKSLGRFVDNGKGGIGSRQNVKERILKPTLSTHGYLMVGLSKEGKVKTIAVHKLVAMSFLNHIPNGHKIVCDHIDNNPLNNNIENLQLISHRENLSKDKKGSSKYTGVCWHKQNNKWMSRIWVNGKYKNLGCYKSELEASKAYQEALCNL